MAGLKIVHVYRAAYNAAIRGGWTVQLTGGGHLRWQPPAGGPVFTPGTPSSHRGTARDLCRLRRAGLAWGKTRAPRPRRGRP